MMTRKTCSWCDEVTGERQCPSCGHRADLARLDCDCPACERSRPLDADGNRIQVGDRVEFVEPYQGFTHGDVAELLAGILGPNAGVRIAPGRTVDTACRRLRRITSP